MPRKGETLPAGPSPASGTGSPEPAGRVRGGRWWAQAGGRGRCPGRPETADLAELDTLPGVGPVLAQRILDWRAAHGRFTSVDELGEVSGIGEKAGPTRAPGAPLRGRRRPPVRPRTDRAPSRPDPRGLAAWRRAAAGSSAWLGAVAGRPGLTVGRAGGRCRGAGPGPGRSSRAGRRRLRRAGQLLGRDGARSSPWLGCAGHPLTALRSPGLAELARGHRATVPARCGDRPAIPDRASPGARRPPQLVLGRGSSDRCCPDVVDHSGCAPGARARRRPMEAGAVARARPLQGRLAPPTRRRPGRRARPVSAARCARDAGLVAAAAERLRAGLRAPSRRCRRTRAGCCPAWSSVTPAARRPTSPRRCARPGMTHLTAVSGSNVAVVLAAGPRAVPGRRVRRRGDRCLALVAARRVRRARPARAQRRARGRDGRDRPDRAEPVAPLGPGLPVLGAAIVVLLVVDPWLARSFGFALSSLATLGLLLFTRRGAMPSARAASPVPWLGPALAIPVAAQAMTAPVIVLLQGSVSVVGVARQPARGTARPAGHRARGRRGRSWPWRRARSPRRWPWAACCRPWASPRSPAVFAEVPWRPLPWPDGATGRAAARRAHRAVLLTGPRAGRRRRGPPACSPASRRSRSPRPRPHPHGHLAARRLAVRRLRRRPGRRPRARAAGRSQPSLVDAGPDPPLVDRCLRHLGVDTPRRRGPHPLPRRPRRRAPRCRRRRAVAAAARRPGSASRPTRPTRSTAWRAHTASRSPCCYAGDRLAIGDGHRAVWSPPRRIADGSVPNNASLVLRVAHRHGRRPAARRRRARGRARPAAAHPPRARRLAATHGFEVVKTPHHGSANLDDRPDRGGARTGRHHQRRQGQRLRPPGAAPPRRAPRRTGTAVYRTDQRGDVAVVERRGAVSVADRAVSRGPPAGRERTGRCPAPSTMTTVGWSCPVMRAASALPLVGCSSVETRWWAQQRAGIALIGMPVVMQSRAERVDASNGTREQRDHARPPWSRSAASRSSPRCPSRTSRPSRRSPAPAPLDVGTVLTTEGEVGEEFFVIERGVVTISAHDPAARTLGPGDFLGDDSSILFADRNSRRHRGGPFRQLVLPQARLPGTCSRPTRSSRTSSSTRPAQRLRHL